MKIFLFTALFVLSSVSCFGQIKAHEVDLSWKAPTPYTDPNAIAGYNVYRSPSGFGTYALINESVVSLVAYKDTSVVGGVSYDYYVTTVDSAGDESTPSNLITVFVPGDFFPANTFKGVLGF